MSYTKHRIIIPDVNGDNVIASDDISIPYGDLPGILKELDIFFSDHHLKEAGCIGVLTENTVGCAVVILYLLSEGINFFLLPADSPVNRIIPPFCDWILSPGLIYSGHQAGRTGISSQENPGHTGGKRGIAAGSGAVCFSSSGTTGAAKYIHFRRDRLVQNARNCAIRFDITGSSKVLVPVPVSHMYGMGVGLLPAMLCGACLFLIEKNNIVKLMEGTKRFQPTITLITPTVAKMMLLLNKRPGGQGAFITAGEKIGRKTYLDFELMYGPLLNLYGCTELGAIGVSPGEEGAAAVRPDGVVRPLKGVEIRIDGDSGQIECRHNGGFESYVDGNGMPHGAPAYQDGWYATQDMGRMEGGAEFKVLGRMDNCVNRSGFLVSLDEVGAVLEDLFQEINRAVVFENDEDGGVRTGLTAVCELNPGAMLDGDAMKKVVRDKMNRHQAPDKFYFIQDMPRLKSGKPDRILLMRHYKELVKNKP